MPVPERFAQRRYVVVQAPGRGRRRRLAPQGVDQALPGDGLVGVHEQNGEQHPLAAVRDLNAVSAIVDLQLSEDAVAHRVFGRPYQATGHPRDPPHVVHERRGADAIGHDRAMCVRERSMSA
jgi:hypothetical protein